MPRTRLKRFMQCVHRRFERMLDDKILRTTSDACFERPADLPYIQHRSLTP
jgi:hypothetical protein